MVGASAPSAAYAPRRGGLEKNRQDRHQNPCGRPETAPIHESSIGILDGFWVAPLEEFFRSTVKLSPKRLYVNRLPTFENAGRA